MTVTAIDKDPVNRTMRLTATFDAPVEQVWQLWADARLLERWWGPPTYPATFQEHELSAGGRSTYFMTGPEGDRAHGCWAIVSVDAPHVIELDDSFADEHGAVNPDMPTTRMRVDINAADGGTTMTITSVFPSAEVMEQMVAMGMEEGIRHAAGQMDDLLAEVGATK